MNLMKILLLGVSCAVLTACPSKNRKEAKPSIVKKYVVMGDPHEVIRGATLDNSGVFEAFSDLSSVMLLAVVDFSEKEEAPDTSKDLSQDSIEEEEAPESEYTGSEASFVEVTHFRSTKEILLIIRDFNIWITLKKENDKQVVFIIESGEDKMKGELIHFSQSADNNTFSLLLSGTDPKDNSKSLIALYFSKKIKEVTPKTTAKPYSYLQGPGIIFNWPKEDGLNIELCGPHPKQLADQLKNDVASWNSALAGKFIIRFKVADQYYPFTDLKQRCFYVVNDLIQEPDSRAATFAVTITIPDYNTAQLIDSDILLFTKEFEKAGVPYLDPRLKNDLSMATLHEMGHMLGLDHVFDGTKSIMAYEDVEPKIHPHDIEAIQALYE
jgi:hypothetical protein